MSGSVTSLKDFNLDNANLGDQINGWEIRWQDFEYDIDRRVPAWSKEHVLALIKNIILRIPDAHGDFVKEICGAANKWDPETDVEFRFERVPNISRSVKFTFEKSKLGFI